MARPRNSSYISDNLIHSVLLTGPKYFQELVDLTRLHRNTVSKRLDFLILKGLVSRNRIQNRVYYSIIGSDEDLLSRLENLSHWSEVLVPLEVRRREKRAREKNFRKASREIATFHGTLDELIDLEVSQDFLESIPNWEQITVDKIYWILLLNRLIVRLNINQQICPFCLHYGTNTNYEHNEVYCERCRLIIGDEIISNDTRLGLIYSFMKDHNLL